LVIERSAIGLTVSGPSVEELLAGAGSVVPAGAATVAVFDNVPVALPEICAVTVKVAVPPLARLTIVEMLPDPLADAQLDPAEATHVQFALLIAAGSVSVTAAPVTFDGPLLVTMME
jgi:hypothetical protein